MKEREHVAIMRPRKKPRRKSRQGSRVVRANLDDGAKFTKRPSPLAPPFQELHRKGARRKTVRSKFESPTHVLSSTLQVPSSSAERGQAHFEGRRIGFGAPSEHSASGLHVSASQVLLGHQQGFRSQKPKRRLGPISVTRFRRLTPHGRTCTRVRARRHPPAVCPLFVVCSFYVNTVNIERTDEQTTNRRLHSAADDGPWALHDGFGAGSASQNECDSERTRARKRAAHGAPAHSNTTVLLS
jgi:hypothetical protein